MQLDLANVRLRYYFLGQGSTALVLACDFADYSNFAMSGFNCSNVSTNFVAMGASSTANADTYAELSFSSAPLPPGSSIDVQTRIHDQTYAVTFDIPNNWSNISSTMNSFADEPNIPAYLGGVKVWGAEP